MSDFDDALVLIRLAADPAAFKARIEELRSATAASDEATAESQVALQNLETEQRRLTALETAIRAREVTVGHAELKQAADLAAIDSFKREQRTGRLVQHMGGLTSEPDDTPAAPDPIGDRFAPAMHEATQVRRPRGVRA
jgi:hypothetical protein